MFVLGFMTSIAGGAVRKGCAHSLVAPWLQAFQHAGRPSPGPRAACRSTWSGSSELSSSTALAFFEFEAP